MSNAAMTLLLFAAVFCCCLCCFSVAAAAAGVTTLVECPGALSGLNLTTAPPGDYAVMHCGGVFGIYLPPDVWANSSLTVVNCTVFDDLFSTASASNAAVVFPVRMENAALHFINSTVTDSGAPQGGAKFVCKIVCSLLNVSLTFTGGVVSNTNGSIIDITTSSAMQPPNAPAAASSGVVIAAHGVQWYSSSAAGPLFVVATAATNWTILIDGGSVLKVGRIDISAVLHLRSESDLVRPLSSVQFLVRDAVIELGMCEKGFCAPPLLFVSSRLVEGDNRIVFDMVSFRFTSSSPQSPLVHIDGASTCVIVIRSLSGHNNNMKPLLLFSSSENRPQANATIVIDNITFAAVATLIASSSVSASSVFSNVSIHILRSIIDASVLFAGKFLNGSSIAFEDSNVTLQSPLSLGATDGTCEVAVTRSTLKGVLVDALGSVFYQPLLTVTQGRVQIVRLSRSTKLSSLSNIGAVSHLEIASCGVTWFGATLSRNMTLAKSISVPDASILFAPDCTHSYSRTSTASLPESETALASISQRRSTSLALTASWPRLPTAATVHTQQTSSAPFAEPNDAAVGFPLPVSSVPTERAAVSTYVFAAAYVPGVAFLVQRTMLSQRLSLCDTSTTEPLPVSDSPTRLASGASPSGSYLRGCIVGNWAIWVGVVVLSYGFRFGRARCTGRTLAEATAAVELPGIVYIPVASLLQPTVSASVAVIAYDDRGAGDVALGLASGVGVALLVWVAADRTVRRCGARRYAASGSLDASTVAASVHGAALRRAISALVWAFSDGCQWHDARGSAGFVSRWGKLFEPFRAQCAWFCVVEVVAAVCSGLLGGLMFAGGASCDGLQYALCAANVAYLVLNVVVMPYATPFDRCVSLVSGLLAVVASAAAAAQNEATASNAVVAQIALTLIAVGLFVGQVLLMTRLHHRIPSLLQRVMVAFISLSGRPWAPNHGAGEEGIAAARWGSHRRRSVSPSAKRRASSISPNGVAPLRPPTFAARLKMIENWPPLLGSPAVSRRVRSGSDPLQAVAAEQLTRLSLLLEAAVACRAKQQASAAQYDNSE